MELDELEKDARLTIRMDFKNNWDPVNTPVLAQDHADSILQLISELRQTRAHLEEAEAALKSYLFHDKMFGGNMKASAYFKKWEKEK